MNKKKKKVVLICILILMGLGIVIGGYFLYDYVRKEINGEEKYLGIQLIGEDNIVLNYKDKYIDKGAKANYKSKDITKDIEVSNDIDFEKVGSYSYNYKIKYKKQAKEIKRTIIIVDKEKPKITLNGKSEITLTVGDTYKDAGVKVTDNYDKDLSKNVKVENKVNNKKEGTYKVIYTVKDSSGNLASVTRVVKVKAKPIVKESSTNNTITTRPGIAVLNYHFFYEKESEGCNEGICLKMSRFREQLDYLKNNGFKTLTMKEFVDYMYGKIDVPKKSVLITIDDGAHGTSKINGNHLIPALEKYKMHATLFLITGWWNINNYSSPYLDIQSHTNNLHFGGDCGHRSKVNCVSYNELLNDLKKSLAVVKSNLSFCFPFYDYTENSIKAVKEAGFKVSFIGGNRKATRSDNKYKIPRYPIHDSTTMAQFIKMVN